MRAPHFSVAFCGFGPAGSGLLFNLVKSGKISEAAADGILIVERSRSLGSGRLSEYRIKSNSLADAILECVCNDLLPGEMSDIQRHSPAAGLLELLRGQTPQLGTIGACMSDATERLVSAISQRHRVCVQRQHVAETLTVRNDGTFDIKARSPEGRAVTSRTAAVILNLGGVQSRDERGNLEMLLGSGVPPCVPIISSDAVLRQSEAALLSQFAPLLEKARTLLIAGGSHSAFSVAERLAQASARLNLRRILIAHRSPLRFYHRGTDEAQRYGETIDTDRDICPLSRQVNRFGGLRYRAAQVARMILRSNRLDDYPVEIALVNVAGGPGRSSLAGELRDVGGIVTCFGYQPLLPTILGQSGEALMLEVDDRGLVTDDFGRIAAKGRGVIHGLFSFGLGSGLRGGADVGGEPSYKGRLDGIWLYHNDVGRKVTNGLLFDLHRLKSKYSLEAELRHSQPFQANEEHRSEEETPARSHSGGRPGETASSLYPLAAETTGGDRWATYHRPGAEEA